MTTLSHCKFVLALLVGFGCPARAEDVAPVRSLSAPGFSKGEETARGAYYFKVSSAPREDVKGIVGRGVLPAVTTDPERQHVPTEAEAEWLRGPLDVPSIYVGLHAGPAKGGAELDAGLTWSRVLDEKKRPLDEHAFRPFWRSMKRRADGKAGLENTWHNPQPGEKGYFWLRPGERFSMSIEIVGDERVRFRVSAENPARELDVAFEQAFAKPGATLAWKRVSSIDQFRETESGARAGNEGRAVIPTRARTTGARWEECALLLATGGREPVIGSAFTERRSAELAERFDAVFRRSGYTSAGGETLDIIPDPR